MPLKYDDQWYPMMKITHPIVIWWRGIYGLAFAIGMVWFILQMTLQPQTTEQFAWVTAIEVLVFVTLVLFWWQKKGGNQQKQNREARG